MADEFREFRQQFRCDILAGNFRFVEEIPTEEGGMVSQGTDAFGDMAEVALHDAVAGTVAAVETDEGAKMVSSPAVVEILTAFDIILVTFPTVGVDDIESGLTDFQHVRLDDFIDAEGEDSMAIL